VQPGSLNLHSTQNIGDSEAILSAHKSRREKFSCFSNVQNSRQTLIYRCQAKIASAAGGTLNKNRRAEFRFTNLPAEV